MVKLSSARDIRTYGPRPTRVRAEYINAGLYIFATLVFLCGFSAQLSKEPKSGLALLLLGSAVLVAVNLHDLAAHLAGIDCRVGVLGLDVQFALVEVAVPVVQAVGSVLFFLAVLFLLIQEEKGYDYHNKLEKHAMNMLVVGPVLWLVGSIHNLFQIYERADGHVQILQHSVQVPFLMGSLLFLVGAILNSREQSRYAHHGRELLGRSWVWFGIFGSLLLFIGGLANVVKVFKMLQMDGIRLEKLRGGAQERLFAEREGQVPLIIEEQGRRRKRHLEEGTTTTTMPTTTSPTTTTTPTPYKDVLVGQS